MALDQLLAVLLRETKAEAETLLAAANAEAARIREECATSLAERGSRDEAALEADQRTAVEFALVAARWAARREELLARERMLERVFNQARAGFDQAVVSPVLRDGIAGLAREAIGCLAARSATIRCHPALLEALNSEVSQRPGVQVIADPAAGTGFRLTSDDGTLTIDATLEERMGRMTQKLRQLVSSRLEQGP